MASRRVERVARAIKEAVSEVLRDDVNDPRAGQAVDGVLVTITRVEPTRDLREAKVYYSVLGEANVRRRVAGCLRDACGFIQREVGRRLPMRFCPHLTFLEDAALKEQLEVERLLQQTRRERSVDGESAAEDAEDDDVAPGPDVA